MECWSVADCPVLSFFSLFYYIYLFINLLLLLLLFIYLFGHTSFGLPGITVAEHKTVTPILVHYLVLVLESSRFMYASVALIHV